MGQADMFPMDMVELYLAEALFCELQGYPALARHWRKRCNAWWVRAQ